MIRRLFSMAFLSLATLAALPAGASAGMYTVRSCWDDDGINHAWHQFASNSSVTAYTQCPAGPSHGGANAGLVTRNAIGPGVSPALSRAEMYFDAPPGARIVRVWGDVNILSQQGWQAGIMDETANRWLFCGTTCSSTFGWYPFDVAASTYRVEAKTICGRGDGCPRTATNGFAALRNVHVVLQEDGAPSVSITGGSLMNGGWRNELKFADIKASDPVGIRAIRTTVDGAISRRLDNACDFTFAIPCLSQTVALPIDTAAFSDGGHTLSVDAVDSGGNTRRTSRAFYTDNHPPTRPANLTVDGGSGWRSQNQFTLRWQNPPQSAAPITSAKVELCRLPYQGGACPIVERRAGSSLTVNLPSAGEWRTRVRLVDAAGNVGLESYAEIVLRLDQEPPRLALQVPPSDRPTLIRAKASDRSGPGTQEMLLRRRGTTTWRSLPVKGERDGFSAVVDDEAVPDGVYEVRAHAVDLAGNEASTDRRTDGKPLLLALPLRIRTRLTVGKPTRVHAHGAHGRYRIKLVRSPRARFGHTIRLRGRLMSPGGNPLASREVRVFEQTRVPGATWRAIATLQTNSRGQFTFRALRGPSRTLRFRYDGSDTIRGHTSEVRLGVRAAISIHASRGRVVNGEDVTFRGRLGGKPRPTPGKLVEIQARARGGWRTFATTRANARSGRWSYRYRFSATRGNVRYRFRARVPKEAGYPYETGVSRAVPVRVRGL